MTPSLYTTNDIYKYICIRFLYYVLYHILHIILPVIYYMFIIIIYTLLSNILIQYSAGLGAGIAFCQLRLSPSSTFRASKVAQRPQVWPRLVSAWVLWLIHPSLASCLTHTAGVGHWFSSQAVHYRWWFLQPCSGHLEGKYQY